MICRLEGGHQGRQHGDAAVRDLGLAPALDLLHRAHAAVGAADQVGRIEDVLERRADAGQGLRVCEQKDTGGQTSMVAYSVEVTEAAAASAP